MSWIFITILAYFLMAIASVIDKTLLKKDVPNPIVYIFYIALVSLILIPIILLFGVSWVNLFLFFVCLVQGVAWVWALFLMFKALTKDDATRVTPMIGGMTPVFIFILAWYILGEKLIANQLLAFIFLMLGSFLIALDFQSHGALSWFKKKLSLDKKIVLPQLRKTLWLALPSAALFAVSHVLTKYIYTNTDFLSGFVWTRVGQLVTVIIISLIPVNFQAIKKSFTSGGKKKQKRVGGRFLVGQLCGGSGTLLVQYAIFLGSVTLVNALQGLQYAFIFIIVLSLTIFFPKFLKEDMSKEIFFQKIIAVVLIIIGLYFIAT